MPARAWARTLGRLDVAMSNGLSALLGVLSFAPLVGFIVLLEWLTNLAPDSPIYANPLLLSLFGAAYVIASWIVTMGAIVLALRSPQLGRPQKFLWALALFLLNMFALPVFWYMCIRRSTRGDAT